MWILIVRLFRFGFVGSQHLEMHEEDRKIKTLIDRSVKMVGMIEH